MFAVRRATRALSNASTERTANFFNRPGGLSIAGQILVCRDGPTDVQRNRPAPVPAPPQESSGFTAPGNLRTPVNFARKRSSRSPRSAGGTLSTISSKGGTLSPMTGAAPRLPAKSGASPRALDSDRKADSSASSGHSDSSGAPEEGDCSAGAPASKAASRDSRRSISPFFFRRFRRIHRLRRQAKRAPLSGCRSRAIGWPPRPLAV